jgi:TRAP-type C4-dicarboxylate transport system permease small subunit
MKTTIGVLATFDKWLVQILRSISILGFTLLLLLLAGNVFARILAGLSETLSEYAFAKYIPIVAFYWFDEVVEWAFAWMVFFGAAALWARDDHFRLEWFPQKMQTSRTGRLVLFGLELLSLFFLLVFATQSLRLTILAKDWTPVFNVSRRFLYACMPISGFIMVGYSIRNLVRELHAFIRFSKPTPEQTS